MATDQNENEWNIIQKRLEVCNVSSISDLFRKMMLYKIYLEYDCEELKKIRQSVISEKAHKINHDHILQKHRKEIAMKTLNTIQRLFKIGKVLSRIVYIFCIVGAVGCAAGMICLPFGDMEVFKIGGVTIHGLIGNDSEIDLNSLYAPLAGAMLICIGQAVAAKFSEKYFARELTAGTPFTLAGAKELFRLGIITICVPLGTQTLAEIVTAIITKLVKCGEAFDIGSIESVTLGVMFIVMSLLCRYGAEMQAQTSEDES